MPLTKEQRLARLRAEALSHEVQYTQFYLCFYRDYYANAEKTQEVRYSHAFRTAMRQMTPVISDGELIVGRPCTALTAAEEEEWETSVREQLLQTAAEAGDGQDSHMAVDYPLVLSKGISGILEHITEKEQTCPPEQLPFYAVCRECLLGVVEFSARYAAHAESLAADCTDAERRAELTEIARICRKVPLQPADTFAEAVQSAHFVTFCLSCNPYRPGCQQFQLGRPDRWLLPYYEKSLADGTVTPEQAQLLLDLLAIQINNRVPNGLSSGYMVGGRDTAGRPVVNDLTYMGMRAVDEVQLVYPSVGLCYTDDMPPQVLETACEILSHGRSHPAIFNDDLIRRGLRHYGVSEREAFEYIHSTCVEITPVAASNNWVASPYTNMVQLLLDVMDTEYTDFDALVQAVLRQLDEHIRANFEEQNGFRIHRLQHSINPLLSCFVNDCLARGVDIEKGGARYNWIMPSFVGMANLVDSLAAVRTVVFEKKEMTLLQLKAAADADFAGQEPLRQYLLNGIPKYGNDDDTVDGLFEMLVDHIVTECEKYIPILGNARLVPSVFCWIMHEAFGRETAATPDGRHAGFPLADGSGPCQGREKKGPTAAVLSATKWPHDKLIGGVAVNLKFRKSGFGGASLATMQSIIRTYIARGGFEIQINVVDGETLRRARQDPESYRDLVVRIGGYSDYFVKLSPNMQDELIQRTEHEI